LLVIAPNSFPFSPALTERFKVLASNIFFNSKDLFLSSSSFLASFFFLLSIFCNSSGVAKTPFFPFKRKL